MDFYLSSISNYILQNYVEVIGAILTIIYVWLNIKENAWNWFFCILGTFCYIYVAYSAKLWGFCLLNIFFVLVSIYGWWNWRFGNKNAVDTLAITKSSASYLLKNLVIGVILTIFFALILSKTGNPAPFFDAFIFAFSLIAQVLSAQKKLESWLFWIAINLITCVMFSFLAYWTSVIVYVILFFLAIQGYSQWKQEQKASE